MINLTTLSATESPAQCRPVLNVFALGTALPDSLAVERCQRLVSGQIK